MYNTCLRIVKEPMTAEDIMQDSFLAAFQRLRNFRNEMPFSHWLRKIVINRSLDYLRKKNSIQSPLMTWNLVTAVLTLIWK